MIRVPCPDLNGFKSFTILTTLVVGLLISPALGGETVQFLKMDVPELIFTGDNTDFTITAYTKDKAKVSDAEMTVRVSVYAKDFEVSKDIKMVDGQGKVSFTFDVPRSYLCNFENINNQMQSGSAFIRVKSADLREQYEEAQK